MRTGTIIYGVFTLISVLSLSVQAEEQPEQQWVALYNGTGNSGDQAKALAIDNSGNIYVTGISKGIGLDYDYATIKYDPNGNELWVARYNGPDYEDDRVSALDLDDSGNVYITGSDAWYGVWGNEAITTIKYDTNGNELWVERHEAPYAFAIDLAVDNEGNVYVTGVIWDDLSWDDWATIKYDTNGNQLWVARYNGPGNNEDVSNALTVDDAGNIYVTGESNNSDTYGDYDYATVMYDNNGKQLWEARYNGPGDAEDGAYGVAVDNLGNVYVTGSSVGNTSIDGATIKYDSNGNQLWVARYNGQGNYISCLLHEPTIDIYGNVYVTGTSRYALWTETDYVTIKYAPDGNQLWVNRYASGRDDAPKALALDKSSNVYVTGISSNYCHTIKYDPNGNQLWFTRDQEGGNDLALDNSGNVYLTGRALGEYGDYGTIKYTQHDYCLSPIDGDLNGNCKVDFVDFAMFSLAWLGNDFADLKILAKDWLKCNFALEEDCW